MDEIAKEKWEILKEVNSHVVKAYVVLKNFASKYPQYNEIADVLGQLEQDLRNEIDVVLTGRK